MKIRLKESLELIPLDDDSMAIFDPNHCLFMTLSDKRGKNFSRLFALFMLYLSVT